MEVELLAVELVEELPEVVREVELLAVELVEELPEVVREVELLDDHLDRQQIECQNILITCFIFITYP
jgi:hypothetical protein